MRWQNTTWEIYANSNNMYATLRTTYYILHITQYVRHILPSMYDTYYPVCKTHFMSKENSPQPWLNSTRAALAHGTPG